MHLETSSNLYGVTVNPFNRDHTSGGSSGGEGALLGLNGSCLGIGSDIGKYQGNPQTSQCSSMPGGSIRGPAANNGRYGFRPTTSRLPMLGCLGPNLGLEYIDASMGPLSTSLEGLEIFMKTVLAAKPWLTDPSLLAMPWNSNSGVSKESVGSKKLKVGVLWDDGVVKPHPPVTRALREMVEKMEKLEAFEVMEFKPYKHDLAWEIIVRRIGTSPK